MINISKLVQDKSHILWDFNGTILDDAHLCVKAVNVLLKEHKLPEITVEDYHQKFTFPVSEYYRDIGFDLKTVDFVQLSERFHQMYHQWLHEADVFPGLQQVFLELEGKSHHVLSAANIHDLHHMIERFGLKANFRSVHGLGDRLGHSKVDLGRELMRVQGLNPADCVMFGDTLHDLEVGHAIGVETILITGGHQHEDRLRTKTQRIWKRGGKVPSSLLKR